MGYEVRRLETRDLFRVARIVRGMTSGARAALIGAVRIGTGEDGEGQTVQIQATDLGLALFEAAVDQEDEIRGLFADLVGLTPQDLDHEPFDALIVILERVMEQDDLPAFFGRVLGLATTATAVNGSTKPMTGSSRATAGRTRR